MLAYAGIGSREITEREGHIIRKTAAKLSKHFVVYSGNADGADIAFQKGSWGKCVLMLPWPRFNDNKYPISDCLDSYVLGTPDAGLDYHPAPERLSSGQAKLMSRNFYQINGYGEYPMVSFVLCCAQPTPGGVAGGTGQAVRIAKDYDIPVINIRVHGWKDELKELCTEIVNANNK